MSLGYEQRFSSPAGPELPASQFELDGVTLLIETLRNKAHEGARFAGARLRTNGQTYLDITRKGITVSFDYRPQRAWEVTQSRTLPQPDGTTSTVTSKRLLVANQPGVVERSQTERSGGQDRVIDKPEVIGSALAWTNQECHGLIGELYDVLSAQKPKRFLGGLFSSFLR